MLNQRCPGDSQVGRPSKQLESEFRFRRTECAVALRTAGAGHLSRRRRPPGRTCSTGKNPGEHQRRLCLWAGGVCGESSGFTKFKTPRQLSTMPFSPIHDRQTLGARIYPNVLTSLQSRKAVGPECLQPMEKLCCSHVPLWSIWSTV